MKNIFTLFFSFTFFSLFSQNTIQKSGTDAVSTFSFSKNILIEDHQGRLITDPILREAYFIKKQQAIDNQKFINSNSVMNQTATPLCTNGGFEEFESITGSMVLKNFLYTTTEPLNPIQCKAVAAIASQGIKRFDPSDSNLMASTVPANYLDEFIGNINGFDQYSLKVNCKNGNTLGLVQAKRFKTNNETSVKFNFKTVLQSIADDGHIDEQPYFKARILNKNGVAIKEFCVIGDPKNCIFSEAPNLESGSIVLYTEEWQSGILDISSIPNNEEFTIEFMAARCGLGAHFGYAYIDDICLLHSSQNLQGSIELDPLYKICPSLPISVCGKYTLPNSGGVSATVSSITMNVYNSTNTVVYTTNTTASLDLTTRKFCFDLTAANLPDVITGNYNIGVNINYGIVQTDCAGTTFASAIDNDANPGWDIAFMNCNPNCDFTLQPAKLELCDTNHDGKEFFNLTDADALIAGAQTGLTFSYFTSINNATTNTNPITSFANYNSTSDIIYVRVNKAVDCFKIMAIELIVRNPSATITGILNVCGGSTTLTATSGASYLWSNGDTTQSTIVTTIGTYTVAVTDDMGCISNATVTINANQVAVQPTIQITQPNCFTTTGTISVTSAASEYSYDGGVTWSTNSVMTNLAVGDYLVKIKTAAGCISYNTNIKIIPFLTSFPHFNSVNPLACGGLGSITITTLSDYYSFDDGVTWTTNNEMTNLPVGTYLIRTKDAFGCISNFNSVVLNGEFLDRPEYTVVDPYCGTLGSITITTPASEYSFDGGTTWQTSNTLDNLSVGSYIIKIKNNLGCTSPNQYVYLNNFNTSYPTYEMTDAGCGTHASIKITTPADFYSFDSGITWTTDPVKLNLTSGIYYNLVIRRGLNCRSLRTSVYIHSYLLPIPQPNDYATILCDALNDGSENIDLKNYNSDLITNATSFTFTYFRSRLDAENNNTASLISNTSTYNVSNSNNTVYVRVTSSSNCFKVAELNFTLIPSPIITNIKDKYPLCVNKTIDVDAGAGFYSYLWSTGATTQTITINQDGNYWVTVTENNNPLICPTTKNFHVFLSNPATITNIQTQDWTSFDNTITVHTTGLGNYEYSLDNINYQDSPVFSGLESGIFDVYVRDKNGCGTVDGEIYLLMYSKFFTPNGDDFHDTWKIKLSNYEPGLKIKIFDSNGKFLKELDHNMGWDGTYNNQNLPATDYWFVVTRSNGKEHRGHFALKR